MCLAVPGRILSIQDDDPLRMGTVAFGEVQTRVCLSCVPEAGIGDYVIVHAGFAISRLSEEAAAQTLATLAELDDEAPR